MTEEYLINVDATWPELGDGGCVAVRDGAIVPPDRLESPLEIEFDASDAVLTPGWMNAHAHLELSGATDISYHGDFVDWIYDVLEFKLSREEEQIRSAFRSGCEELIESGVCRVFDHCDRTDWIVPEAESVAIDARVLKELIAFLPEQIEETLSEARSFLNRLSNSYVDGGLAPHAPYSAHPDLYGQARELVADAGGLFSTHLHETMEEMNFVTDSEGRFQDLLEDRTGSRRDSPYDGRPLGDLSKEGLFDEPGLSVHMNYLTEDDHRWLEGQNCYPVFCPRSYDYFGHDTIPVREWDEREIPFCLGTDSRASNSGLNMLDELKKLHELAPGLSSDTIMKSLTVRPSRVMGEPDRGELTYGTPADLSIFEVPSGHLDDLARGQAEALAVFVDGDLKYRADGTD